MDIIHESGKAYDLGDIQLTLSRMNPFFNDYGEQSLPVTLPPTDRNRELLIYPDNMAEIGKASQRINAMIQHGVFSIPCRQAILSANRKTGIETSFYLNTGAFYEKIKDVPLSTVFEDKVLKFASVSEAISFCRNLFITHDDRFALFPAILESGSLNATGDPGPDGYPRLYNDVERTEVVDEKTIRLAPGFYISPFIRGLHLLEEIFAYLGYTLEDSFFSRTTPFKDMVFLNNTIDTIVRGEIRYSQIVPDCMIKTILDVYRYKFCCEFIPDETRKTIRIVLFDENLNETPSCDLTDCVAGKYTVNHPSSFKQLKLTCDRLTPPEEKQESERPMPTTGRATGNENEEFSTLVDLLKKYPDVEYNQISGEFVRRGYKGITPVTQRISLVTMDYYAGGTLETESKESPDVLPAMVYTPVFGSGGAGAIPHLGIYIGTGRSLNSSIIMDSVNDSTSEVVGEAEDNEELKPMPAFVFHAGKLDYGTILNHDADGNKLWNYTLAYHGPDGLFERFWRNYDSLLRNSLLEIKASMLLSDIQKVSLSEYRKVTIEGQELLPSAIQYSPGSREPLESTFLTTRLYEPVSTAMAEAERFASHVSKYKWKVNYSRSNASDSVKRRWVFKEEPVTIYYAPPSAYQYVQGGKYHQATYPVQFYSRGSASGPTDPEDGTLTVWLEPVTR